MFEITVLMHRFFPSQNISLHLLVNKAGWWSKYHNETETGFFIMTANLVLTTTTAGDRSESANVLIGDLGMTKNKKESIY